MKELNLEIRSASDMCPSVLVDGKLVKTKKNKFGTRSCTVKTEKDNVDVVLIRNLEINGKLWFFMNIFYFIISLFGIFDPGYDKKCVVMDCKFNLEVKEKTKAVIVINGVVNNGKAVTIQSDAGVVEDKNIYFVDNKAKKKRKVAKWTRFVLMVIIVIALVTLL